MDFSAAATIRESCNSFVISKYIYIIFLLFLTKLGDKSLQFL